MEEINAVGTHEFFDLIDMLGADAYVNGNVGTGSVQEMSDWVEYMTADGGSPLARLRAQNGRDKAVQSRLLRYRQRSCGAAAAT